MRLLQVLGTNGAGKSALLRALAGRDVDAYAQNGYTVLPALRTIMVGDYLRADVKTPGADGIHTKQDLLLALDGAVNWAKAQPFPWTVAWEGIIIMTRQYHSEYVKRRLEPLYVVMSTSLELCFARIQERSGKTKAQLKGEGRIVTDRAQAVRRLAAWLKAQEAEVLWLDGKASVDFNAGRVIRAAWRVRPGALTSAGTSGSTTRPTTTPVT